MPLNRPTNLKKVSSDEAEIDFAIVHRHIGVVLIEGQSTRKFSKLLQAGEQKIWALLQIDQSEEVSIPVYKTIAMPNVSEPGRRKQQ